VSFSSILVLGKGGQRSRVGTIASTVLAACSPTPCFLLPAVQPPVRADPRVSMARWGGRIVAVPDWPRPTARACALATGPWCVCTRDLSVVRARCFIAHPCLLQALLLSLSHASWHAAAVCPYSLLPSPRARARTPNSRWRRSASRTAAARRARRRPPAPRRRHPGSRTAASGCGSGGRGGAGRGGRGTGYTPGMTLLFPCAAGKLLFSCFGGVLACGDTGSTGAPRLGGFLPEFLGRRPAGLPCSRLLVALRAYKHGCRSILSLEYLFSSYFPCLRYRPRTSGRSPLLVWGCYHVLCVSVRACVRVCVLVSVRACVYICFNLQGLFFFLLDVCRAADGYSGGTTLMHES